MKDVATSRLRTGMGLVELLIALGISAMLLTAVAAAFHSSLNVVEENEKIATVTQNGRVVLNRLLTEARTAVDVQCETFSVSILPPLDGSGITLVKYELIDGTLWYRQTKSGLETSYPVIGPEDGVVINGFAVSYVSGLDANGQTCTKSITARLDLQVGVNRFAVTSSTNPRRNMIW